MVAEPPAAAAPMSLPLPFVVATQNPDKAREIIEIFVHHAHTPLAAFALDDVAFLLDVPDRIATTAATMPAPTTPPDVEETGNTLEANARIKARALCDAFNVLAVADDTGLEVDALDGAPGVHSARYAGEHASYADNVARLLRELEGVSPSLRTARFATSRWRAGPTGGSGWCGARSRG